MKEQNWKSIQKFLTVNYCCGDDMAKNIEQEGNITEAIEKHDIAYLVDMLDAIQILTGEMIIKLQKEKKYDKKTTK